MTEPRRMKLIVVALPAAALVAGARADRRHPDSAGQNEAAEPGDWGRAELSVSEKAYYKNRVSHVLGRWRETARSHRRAEPYNVYLVLDANKPALWLEENGRVLERNYAEFPKNMQWEVYHATLEGKQRLSGLLRLKVRVPYGKRQALPEGIWLWGHGRRTGNMTVYISARDCTTGYSESPPNIAYRGGYTKDREFGESIVVSEANYDEYQRSLGGDPLPQRDLLTLVSEPNVSDWLKVEKHIYWEIERRTLEQGYVFGSLNIRPFAEHRTARGELRVHYRSGFTWPSQLNDRNIFPEPVLKIDHLGDGVWYVQGIEKRPGAWSKSLRLEFLVAARGEIAKDRYRVLLADARPEHSTERKRRAKWTASLANGVKLELAGLCEYPSIGRRWWGPDGGALEYEPIFSLSQDDDPWDDLPKEHRYDAAKQRIELAFAVTWPKGKRQQRTIEIPLAEGRWSRGGSLADDEVVVRPYKFEPARQEFDITIRVSMDNVTFENVTFMNISLVPGRDMGFVTHLQR